MSIDTTTEKLMSYVIAKPFLPLMVKTSGQKQITITYSLLNTKGGLGGIKSCGEGSQMKTQTLPS